MYRYGALQAFVLLLWIVVPLVTAGLLYLVVRWGIRDGLTDARRREAAERQLPPTQGRPPQGPPTA